MYNQVYSNKICRLCLNQSPLPLYFSILENNFTPMLESLTYKKVIFQDDFSKFVCYKCLLNLKLAFKFQQKIKNSEQKLKDLLTVKEEPHYTSLNENVIISEDGEVIKEEKTKDLVKLCDNCPICGLNTDNEIVNAHIKQHLREKHSLPNNNENTEHRCGACGATFRYKSLFKIHTETVCSDRSSVLKQDLTSLNVQLEKSVNKSSIKNNLDDNVRQKALKLGLSSSKAIKLLVSIKSNEKESYTCLVCEKKFLSRRTFQQHGHKTIKCTICDLEVSKFAFKRHMEGHTLGPQVCHVCGVTLRNKSTLVAHIFYSHKNSRYKCDDCGKIFRRRHARDLHVRKEHIGKPTHYCDVCGKGFFKDNFLQKHIKMTHLKLRPYICDFCKKGFSSHYALKTHRRQHTNETPYKCEVCGDGFRQNVSLKAHRKSKHNIVEPKVCECKVCGKGFASNVALLSHMRLH